MDNLLNALKENESLLKDIANHPAINYMFLGILRNIERTNPEDCRAILL